MRKVNLLISNVFIVLAIVTAAIPYIQLGMKETLEMPINDIDVPIVRLSDIEQSTEMVRKKILCEEILIEAIVIPINGV